jgi:hypothetical protein
MHLQTTKNFRLIVIAFYAITLYPFSTAQNFQKSCVDFYEITKAYSDNKNNNTSKVITVAALSAYLASVSPEIIRDPKDLMWAEEPKEYRPNDEIPALCINSSLFFTNFGNESKLTTLNLNNKNVASVTIFGVPIEGWQLTESLFAIHTFINRYHTYTVINIDTGDVLIKPKFDAFETSQMIGLVIGNKLLYQEKQTESISSNQGGSDPATYTLILYEGKNDSLINLGSCEFEVSNNDFVPSTYALANEGLISYFKQDNGEYKLRIFSECQHLHSFFQ